MNEVIPILIPSYQPDERFIDLLKALKEANLGPVVIVDDGSGSEYQHIFKEAEALIVDLGGVLLHHDINHAAAADRLDGILVAEHREGQGGDGSGDGDRVTTVQVRRLSDRCRARTGHHGDTRDRVAVGIGHLAADRPVLREGEHAPEQQHSHHQQ